MAINPTQSLLGLSGTSAASLLTRAIQGAGQTDQTTQSFAELLSQAIGNTEQTVVDAQTISDSLLSGDLDRPHDITIAATEAELMLDLTVQIRNRLVDGYNELMRMQV